MKQGPMIAKATKKKKKRNEKTNKQKKKSKTPHKQFEASSISHKGHDFVFLLTFSCFLTRAINFSLPHLTISRITNASPGARHAWRGPSGTHLQKVPFYLRRFCWNWWSASHEPVIPGYEPHLEDR